MNYMGIDLHKQFLVTTLTDQKGKVLQKAKVATDRNTIRKYFQSLSNGEELSVVMEACYNWSYFYDEIKDLVFDVKIAHPLKTRAIAEARIKTDSIDSEVLAHLLRADLIPEAYAPDFTTRDKKNLLRCRSTLVKTRTGLKNIIHAVLARNYIEEVELQSLTDKFGKKGKTLLRSIKLRGHDTRILNCYLDVIEELDSRLKEVEKELEHTFKEDEICRLIESVPGIGKRLAVLIRYEIDDIQRFISPEKLCSYAGLVPSTYSSGGKTVQGKITKQGNKWLRWAMIEASQQAMHSDLYLRDFYLRIAKHKGSKKARVALARKLLVIVYRIWVEKRPYYSKPVAVAL